MNNIEKFRNLIKQEENWPKSQKEQTDKISEENKTILDKLGLPQFLQSLIDENLVPNERGESLSLSHGVKNEIIRLEITSRDEESYSIIFEAHVMKDKKVVMMNENNMKNNFGYYVGNVITPNNMAQLVFNSVTKKPFVANEKDWVSPCFDQNI